MKKINKRYSEDFQEALNDVKKHPFIWIKECIKITIQNTVYRLRKLSGKLLCFLGLHDWEERELFDRFEYTFYTDKTCRRCLKERR
jgi:hypothetical protein